MKQFSIFLLLFTCTAYGQNEFIDDYKALQPKESLQLNISFSDSLGNQSDLPIVVMKGKQDGPVFTFISGVHGFEFAPIIAVQRLMKKIDVNQLHGTLIILPISSPGSFYNRTPYKNPQDNVNLNNAFPGNTNGTITQKMAYYITQNIIPLSDVFLDIHSGDAPEDLLPFICYYNNKQHKENTAMAKRLSDISGFQYVVSYPYTITDEEPAKYAFKQAVQDGKIALSIESGKLGLVEENTVDLTVHGVLNMLHEMGMYPHHTSAHPNRIFLNHQLYTRAIKRGIFYSEFKAGDRVEEGQIIGHTTNAFGEVIEEHRSPQTGIILYMLATPPINEGDTVACVSSFES